MIRRIIIFLLTILTALPSSGQVLLPTIGLDSLPADSEPICNIPVYTGSYYSSGIQAGDTAADFRLYTLNGDSVILSDLLDTKPVLMIAGSYTCPVFRNKVNTINSIHTNYGSYIHVVVIYTVEAHPVIDISPYSGTVWTTGSNLQQNILYQQPSTYGQRKMVVSDMVNSTTILPEVLIDGPCNEWWSYYGPAPNNAYLIDTTGMVEVKHGWFNKSPDDIACDLDAFMGFPPCPPTQNNGTFNWNLSGSNSTTGTPGDVLEIEGILTNSSNGNASITVIRSQNMIPQGWQSAMCVDVCLAWWTDTTHFFLPANSSQSFIMYFYTDAVPGQGFTTVRFLNDSVPGNHFQQNFIGSTLNTGHPDKLSSSFAIFPNPVGAKLNISFSDGFEPGSYAEIIDLQGSIILKETISQDPEKIELSGLSHGTYFIRVVSGSSLSPWKKFVRTK